MPNPIHPRAQLLCYLCNVTTHTFLPVCYQISRLPTGRDYPLRSWSPDVIIGRESIWDLIRGLDLGEQGDDDECIFDSLAGALALIWGSCVSSVTHHGDPILGVKRSHGRLAHLPARETRSIE